MSTAFERNFAASQGERSRRLAAMSDSPSAELQQADYLGPAWDAFYGSLHDAAQAAGKQGLGFRADLSGIGQPASNGGYLGTLNPFDREALKNVALQQNFNATTEQAQAEKLAQQAQLDADERNRLADQYRLYGQQVQASEVPTQPTTVTQRGNAYTMRPAGTPEDQMLAQLPPAERVKAMQALAAAKLASAKETETERHNKATEAAANPFGLQTQPGPAAAAPSGAAAPTTSPSAAIQQGVTGDAFLKTLPAPIAKQVQAYAEGRLPFPSGFALKAPYFQQMLQAVGQYDPSFDAVNYNARNKAYSDMTSPNGNGGKTINALNTAANHIGQLSDLIEKLGNTNYPIVNAIENPIGKAFGSTKVTNFEAVQPQAMKEIERLWRGAGGSQSDIDKLKESLGPNMGIQQQREALANFADLMLGKLDATRQQRDNVLGPTASQRIPVLFDQNRPTFSKIFQRAGMAVPDVVAGHTAGASGTTKKETPEERIQRLLRGGS